MASGCEWRARAKVLMVASLLWAAPGVGRASAEEKPAEKPKPETQVDASRGGLTVQSGDNSLTFGVYVQVRGLVDDRELYDADGKGTPGAGRADGWVPAFDVARVRLSVKGTMFSPSVRYNVSVEAARTLGESDSKIKDAYLELGGERLAVRAGQYKVPFGLQTLTPDWGQELVDRSIASLLLTPDRDTGVLLLGYGKRRTLGWSLGVFNGSGESRRQNNAAVMWSARVWADPLGEYKLSEGAVEAPKRSVLHLGLAVRGGDAIKGGQVTLVQYPDAQAAVALETAFKRDGLFVTGEAFWQRTEPDQQVGGPAVEALGWQAQAGYMIVARRLELDLRYSEVDSNRDLPGDRATELRSGVNYYWKGHNLKLQTDLGWLVFDANGPGRSGASRLPEAAGRKLTDFQARAQLQLYF
jgi:phosphate-selective porin OprO/OprP